MDNMILLWEYQKADSELRECEAKIINTPTRKKLVQLKKFYQNGQAKLVELEKAAVIKQHRISEIDSKNKSYEADMEDLNQDLGYYSECDEEELDEKTVKEMVENCQSLFEKINSSKKEIVKIRQQIEDEDKVAKELLLKMKRAKEEYDVLMVEHKKEVEAGSKEIETYKEKLKEAEEKLPEKLISEYKRIKGFRQNPVAKLENDRCSGCKMQLPASVVTKINAKDELVTCENCGRILVSV